jgi:O-succinylbenzoate synthase
MNATENFNGNSSNGMKLHEACEYMNMEPQELKDLLLQLGYSEAPNCDTVPTEYVAKLEDIKGKDSGQQGRAPECR